jgi:hypothetical protein
MGEFDSPDPSKIVRDTRALIQGGELTLKVAVGGQARYCWNCGLATAYRGKFSNRSKP